MANKYSDYVTAADVKAHLEKSLATHDDQIERAIAAARAFTDEKTGRGFRFYEAETRYAQVQWDGSVPVVDLISVTTIHIDVDNDLTYSQSIADDSYILEPRNDPDGSPAHRFQKICPFSGGDDSRYFVPGRQVKIVGDWGFVETADGSVPTSGTAVTPEMIQYANVLLVARWYKRRESPVSATSMPAFGFRRMFEGDKDAMDILEEFTHPRKRRTLQ